MRGHHFCLQCCCFLIEALAETGVVDAINPSLSGNLTDGPRPIPLAHKTARDWVRRLLRSCVPYTAAREPDRPSIRSNC